MVKSYWFFKIIINIYTRNEIMKKISLFCLLALMSLTILFGAVPLWAQLFSAEKNYHQLQTLSCRMETTVTNTKGTMVTKGRILISGSNKRLDSISPDRMTFALYRDSYSVYSYQDKKLVTKKMAELSDTHRVFLEEMFWSILFDPFAILSDRYIFPPYDQKNDLKSPISLKSRRDPDARAVGSFDNSIITKIDYFYKTTLTKSIVFSSTITANGVTLPGKAVLKVYNGDRETMRISMDMSDVVINSEIPDSSFTKLVQ